jgi:hypothetical protein
MSASTREVATSQMAELARARCKDAAQVARNAAVQLRPLSPYARQAFTARGTCTVCGLTDVCGRLVSGTHLMVCAQCVMIGRVDHSRWGFCPQHGCVCDDVC